MAQAVGPDTDGAIAGANNGEGIGVLINRTSGVWNTGTGFEALNHLTAGNQNTATGLRALFSDTNGGFNTATGVVSLFSNTSGFFNTATGAYSLANNTVASFNTANGYGALYFNTEGERNTAIGFGALFKNTTGGPNVAVGVEALNKNTQGSANNAVGYSALFQNTEGFFNNAHGNGALFSNTTGLGNNAFGDGALFSNVTGDSNTAIGDFVGISITGSGNVCIGANVFGVAGENNTTRIKNIGTTPLNTGMFVEVDADGKLGFITSSRRYKHDIQPMGNASEALFALKPVTFRYNGDIDPAHVKMFGLIAEEVAKVSPDLAVRNAKGEIAAIRFDSINAMLLNEFLKAHRKAQQQEATIAELKNQIETVVARLKEQDSKIQKVSAQLEMSKPAPKTVSNK
jgi:hypothetical protein